MMMNCTASERQPCSAGHGEKDGLINDSEVNFNDFEVRESGGAVGNGRQAHLEVMQASFVSFF